jgi:hypothetical protein
MFGKGNLGCPTSALDEVYRLHSAAGHGQPVVTFRLFQFSSFS